MSKLSFKRHLKNKSRSTARDQLREIDALDECYVCGHTGRIDVHHIDGDALNNHLINLIPLCYPCHRQVHRWQQTVRYIDEMKAEFADLGTPQN